MLTVLITVVLLVLILMLLGRAYADGYAVGRDEGRIAEQLRIIAIIASKEFEADVIAAFAAVRAATKR